MEGEGREQQGVRPTLILVGLGEAGQQILRRIESLGLRLRMIYEVVDEDVERAKLKPLKPVEVKEYLEYLRYLHRGLSAFEEGEREGDEALSGVGLLRDLQEGAPLDFTQPPQTPSDLGGGAGDDLGLDKVAKSLNPIVSPYGISMIRIDVDEQTLRGIAEEVLNEGLPVPPGIVVASEAIRIYDPVLGEYVSLSPAGGSQGRSGAVYNLIRETESRVVLDLLGIPTQILVDSAAGGYRDSYLELLARLSTAIPSYRTFVLIHGLVGTGPGVAIAILDALREHVVSEGGSEGGILDPIFKVDFTIVPSAEELELSRLDPPSWSKVVRWNLDRLRGFIEDGILDTIFLVDLDFAAIQLLKNEWLLEGGANPESAARIRRIHNFIKRLYNGELGLYTGRELKKYSGLNPGNIVYKYNELDELVAYALEPLLVVHGPRDSERGLMFAAGGSSVDEMEIKEIMRGAAVIPFISEARVFDVYFNMEKRAVERGIDLPDEASLASLLVPTLHSPLAPIVRDFIEKFIVIINIKTIDRIMEEFDYIPPPADIADTLKKIFDRVNTVKVLISKTPLSTSVILYGLLDPGKYIESVLKKKGWTS